MPKPLSNPQYSDAKPSHGKSDSERASAPAEQVWDQFGELFDLMEEMVQSPPSISEFYQRLLAETVAGFAATAGRAWLPIDEGGFQLLTQVGPKPALEDQTQYEQMLAEVSQSARTMTKTIGSQSVSIVSVASRTKSLLGTKQPSALIELVQRTDCPDELYRSTERLLEAIAHVALDYHKQQQNEALKKEHRFQQALLQLAQQVSGDLRLGPTSYRIVNNCRQLLKADRVSLVRFGKRTMLGSQAKLLAVSGVEELDNRSASAKALLKLSKMIQLDRRAMSWTTGSSEKHQEIFPEECWDQLDAYADLSHVKMLVAVPLFMSNALGEETTQEEVAHSSNQSEQQAVEAVLVVESFKSSSIEATTPQIQLVAQVCAPAFEAAIKTTFAQLQNLLRRWLMPSKLLAVVTALAIACGLIYFANVVQVEHTVTLRGSVQPLQKSEIYAPADARVASALVSGGERVVAGDKLLELRDTSSLLELQKLEGELLAAERQHDSVATTRMSLDRRATAPTEALRLAAEQERLALRMRSLSKEIELVEEERKKLTVISPLSGMITTWQPEDLLINRPVKRGQRLLTVVDDTAGYKIELELPDDRLGILREAEKLNDEPLLVIYELASDPSVERQGRIVRYAPVAESPSVSTTTTGRVICLEVAPDDQLASDQGSIAPLMGVTVRAEVQCGKQSLAYVALHDIWHFLSTRWELGW